jgi:hypothetical protein
MRINIGGKGWRVLAELTLAMVLFTDAANADFAVVRRKAWARGAVADKSAMNIGVLSSTM